MIRAVWSVGRIRWKNIMFSWRAAATLILVGIYIYSSIQPIADFCRDVGAKATPYIAPFMLDEEVHQLFVVLGAVALYAGAPFRDAMYPYIAARSGKTAWAWGNLLGIALTALGYTSFVFLMTLLPLLGRLTFQPEWGKVINTLCQYQENYGYYWNFILRNEIRAAYSPFQAMALSFCLESACIFLCGALEYLGNLISRRPVGLWLAGGVVMLDVSIYNMLPRAWKLGSPLSLARLSEYVRTNYLPLNGIAYGVLFFSAGSAVLWAAVWALERRDQAGRGTVKTG